MLRRPLLAEGATRLPRPLGALYGIGAGIVIAIVYWLLFSLFAAIGTAGLLSPGLAAWGPNFLFFAGAAYLLLTVRT